MASFVRPATAWGSQAGTYRISGRAGRVGGAGAAPSEQPDSPTSSHVTPNIIRLTAAVMRVLCLIVFSYFVADYMAHFEDTG